MKPNSKQAQIAERRARVAKLLQQGVKPVDIAEEIGVSMPTVVRDVKLMRKDWQMDAKQSLDELHQEQVGKFLWAERMSQEGFERSREPWQEAFDLFKEELQEFLTSDDPEIKPLTKALDRLVATRPGDPAFLKLFQEAVDRETKLMGLYGRETIDLNQTVRFDFSQLSATERELLRTTLELKRECERAGVSWPPDSDRMRRFFEAEARGQIEDAIEVPVQVVPAESEGDDGPTDDTLADG